MSGLIVMERHGLIRHWPALVSLVALALASGCERQQEAERAPETRAPVISIGAEQSASPVPAWRAPAIEVTEENATQLRKQADSALKEGYLYGRADDPEADGAAIPLYLALIRHAPEDGRARRSLDNAVRVLLEQVQRVPLYRRDLDIVAVAENGELAAFSTVWFDDVTRTAVFEPVGTHPDHQKRGLGKADMSEGLRRAQRLGANMATVTAYSEGAHALYASIGFTEFDLLEPWIKEW